MTKQIFTQSHQPEEEEILPKQEFYNVETTIDNEPLEGELLDEQFEQIVKPKSSGWKTALKLTALLDTHQAHYHVVEHPTAGKSEEVAKIRGTELGQGAKALVCKVKGNGVKQAVLVILPADQQSDLSKVAAYLGGTKPLLLVQQK